MRGNQDFQGAMFSYISLEERVPQAHPLRKLRAVVDALLATMNREFEAVYARRGRPSVPPEMLLKALLLQILFSIRSERQLVEAINYNLLYRWFVGLNIEDKVWDHSTFSANRERLFNEDLARTFFERVKLSAQWGKLASDEHFSVDGTLIDAWASHKSFKRKDDDSGTPPGRNPEVDFKGQERCNDTHKSTTDADARLFKKSRGDKSRLCHMGHILMENRNGLIVDVEITHASGTAEREAALAMLERRGNRNKRATVGADKGYDSKAFIKGCRKLKVTPHVAAKDSRSISACSGFITPLPGNACRESAFSSRIHALSRVSCTSRSRAACATATPRSVTSLTASTLNSRLNCRLVPINHLRFHLPP
ncbi:IS5 family transposase [Acidovorax ebreus]|uniref:Transposase IS4 family protein n=1 Tax=Acidovorax ebreus (strain TPSY) TaxID=535289 RepID=A0A9J9Q7R6_ACIET|nr:transposase IS4 family protein [[Acidovorax] ebreus TPSY]